MRLLRTSTCTLSLRCNLVPSNRSRMINLPSQARNLLSDMYSQICDQGESRMESRFFESGKKKAFRRLVLPIKQTNGEAIINSISYEVWADGMIFSG